MPSSRQVLLWQYCRGVREAETLPEEPIPHFLQVIRQEYRVDRRRLVTSRGLPKVQSLIRLIRLSDCRCHDLLIALDSYRTVAQGKEDVQLVVILDPVHEVHTDGARRKACPSSSEVLADVVRKRACPSSSEVPSAVVDEAAGLGGWRACLSTPSGSDEKLTTISTTT